MYVPNLCIILLSFIKAFSLSPYIWSFEKTEVCAPLNIMCGKWRNTNELLLRRLPQQAASYINTVTNIHGGRHFQCDHFELTRLCWLVWGRGWGEKVETDWITYSHSTIVNMFIFIWTLLGWVYITVSSSNNNSLHSTMRVTEELYWWDRTNGPHVEISFGWLHIDHCLA